MFRSICYYLWIQLPGYDWSQEKYDYRTQNGRWDFTKLYQALDNGHALAHLSRKHLSPYLG